MAALALAARGVRALLLDRKRFPRDKPCGGGIRYSVFRRFPELASYLRETVAIHEIRGVLMEAPGGATVRAAGDEPFYLTLRRTEFDGALLERARAQGVQVIEGCRVTGVERTGPGVAVSDVEGRVFHAAVLIGADGVNSIVARASGLGDGFANDGLAIDTMEETELAELRMADPDTMYVAYGYKGFPGYGYVFPKRHHVDAGVGFILSFFKTLDGSPYVHHERFLREMALKGVVTGQSNPRNFKAYRLPLGGPLARTVVDRVMLTGDAAGFVNAYTGEGIYYAMVTGQLAGETAARAVSSGDASERALRAYETAWRAEIGDELSDSVRIQRRLFANPRLVDRVVAAAARDPKLCRLFARVALGEESLRRRKLEMAARFLVAPLRRQKRAR